MPDILQTVLDSLTITMKQKVLFQVGICPEKCHFIKFKIAAHWP